MRRAYILVIIGILLLGVMFVSSVSVETSTALQQATATPTIQITPTFDSTRLAQPPTVVSTCPSGQRARKSTGACACPVMAIKVRA